MDDFRDVVTGRIGGQPFPRPRGRDLAQPTLLAALRANVRWLRALGRPVG